MFPESKLLLAAARFELARGGKLVPFEMQQLLDAGMDGVEPQGLAEQIRQSLDSATDLSVSYRSAAFWALGKHDDDRLLEFFRRHLGREVERDMGVAYQIMMLSIIWERLCGR